MQEHQPSPADEQATRLPEGTPPQPWSGAPPPEPEQRAGQHAQSPSASYPPATTASMAASGAATDASDGI